MPGDTFDIRTTTRSELIDVTPLVRSAVRKSGVANGIACVFCPHTTAGLTIQENSDPRVRTDLSEHLAKLVPHDGPYINADNNSDAHIKSSMVGASLTIVIEGGKPVLGTWQAVYFCEFDGPRQPPPEGDGPSADRPADEPIRAARGARTADRRGLRREVNRAGPSCVRMRICATAPGSSPASPVSVSPSRAI